MGFYIFNDSDMIYTIIGDSQIILSTAEYVIQRIDFPKNRALHLEVQVSSGRVARVAQCSDRVAAVHCLPTTC